MAERRIVKIRNNKIYPITHEHCVIDNQANPISKKFRVKGSITIPNEIDALEAKIGSDMVDSTESFIDQLNAIDRRYTEVVKELIEVLTSLGLEPTSEDLDAILEEVQSYSSSPVPKYSRFIRMTMLPTDVDFAAFLIHNNRVYVIGGYTTSAVKTNYMYALENNTHTTYTAMTANRYHIQACYLNDNTIRIVGGYTTASQSTHYTWTIAGSWSTKTALPVKMYEHTVFTFNNTEFYSYGGVSYTQNLYKYSNSTNAWTTVSTAALHSVRSTATVIGNDAYIIGGLDTGARYCRCFNATTQTMTSKTQLPASRAYGGSAYLKGKIYFFGGTFNSVSQTSIYIYDPILNTWSTSSDVLPFNNIECVRAQAYNDDVAIIQWGRYIYCYKPE